MLYRGVEYVVAPTLDPERWHIEIRFEGGVVQKGNTTTRLELMAERRAKLMIDRMLDRT
jgi:hypothetical protein